MKRLRSFLSKKAKDGDGAPPLKEAEVCQRRKTAAVQEGRTSENSERASKEINGLFLIPPPEDGLKQETDRTGKQDGGQPLEAEQVEEKQVPLIVLVHGIGGHWKKSWEWEAFSWIQNFLYHDLREAGLSAVTYSYGYDSRTNSNSVADIEQVALILLGRLEGLEIEAPIVFVAHSLGGLVVKKAMIEAWNNNDRYGAVLERIKACVFLGVPHRGADHVWWKTMTGHLVETSTLGAHGNVRFAESIERASDQWREIAKKFVHRSPKLRIHSFYEMNKKGPLLIVDEDSARMNLPNEYVDPLAGSDHIMLSKFGREERNRYQPVGKAITKIVKGVSSNPAAQDVLKKLPHATEAIDVPLKGRDLECIQQLRVTDPCHDKKRIEDTNGGLLEDSYQWILKNPEFQQWHDKEQSRLLWIKGDPGKGKTMLLCGIINELNEPTDQRYTLSYFFCQATDTRINNATAVLRGLLYMLVTQQPSLIPHIRKKHDHSGKVLFEDPNAWVALTEIFTDVLEDPNLNSAYLIIDALDECTEVDLPKLLDFVARKSSVSSRVKWIVSSRNRPKIEELLKRADHKATLSLELNTESVSIAVSIFIKHKVLHLADMKDYDDETQDAVLRYLSANANDTFLWVALVCQNLEKTTLWNTYEKLNAFPPGLDSLYGRMMHQICNSDDADLCRRILASTAVVYRPITLEELASLVEMLEGMAGNLVSLRKIIGMCGSFLTIRGDTIYFVHQSAKDFLFAEGGVSEIFPYGTEEAHRLIFTRSLQGMSKTLRRDMYSLIAPGFPVDKVQVPVDDPLARMRYSCVHWVEHLCDWNSNSANNGIGSQDKVAIENFIRKKYLYWLEALSLCRSMSEGVLAIAKLNALAQRSADAPSFIKLLQDARLFIMYHIQAIQNSPLQVYVSALIFSPDRSLIRSYFKKEEPKWISIKPAIGDQWSACLQTLKGHSGTVYSVAFSHDSARLASASGDDTVKIWDASSGDCLQTLKGHSNSVYSVAFSHDSAQLASASRDNTVKIWDASSGACLQTLKGHSNSVISVAFSHDSARLASASLDNTVKIWDASSGDCLQTLKGHSGWVISVAFSHDSARLASASYDRTIKIWDASSGDCLQTLKGHSDSVNSVAFSHDSARLASASYDSTIKIWDASSGDCLQTLKDHSDLVYSVAFSHDSARLASASHDDTVKIWDASSGDCLQTLKDHSNSVYLVAFSHDSARLASASGDGTVKIWDASSGDCLQTLIIGQTLFRISFDITNSYLQTNIGTIEIGALSGSRPLQSHSEPQSPQYQGLALSADGVWMAYNSKNLIWLPLEYRPLCSVVSEKMIGIGVGTGRVWICKVELNELNTF